MRNLTNSRSSIDKIDQKILILLKKRLNLAVKIGKYKKEKELPVKDNLREKEIIANLVEDAKSLNLSPILVQKIWSLLLKESRRIQR